MSKEGKTKIIEAAQTVISKNGIFGATVRGIAEEADMSTGAIYHYYKSKEEILYDIMDESLSMSSKIAEEAEKGYKNKEEIIDEIYKNLIKRFEKFDENRLQFYLAQEAMLGNKELQAKFKEKYNQWVTRVEYLMENLYGKHSSNLNKTFASLLIASIDGIVMQILMESNPVSKQEITDVYRLLLLEGIPKFLEILEKSM